MDRPKLARRANCLLETLALAQENPNAEPCHLGKSGLLSYGWAVIDKGEPGEVEASEGYDVAKVGLFVISVETFWLLVTAHGWVRSWAETCANWLYHSWADPPLWEHETKPVDNLEVSKVIVARIRDVNRRHHWVAPASNDFANWCSATTNLNKIKNEIKAGLGAWRCPWLSISSSVIIIKVTGSKDLLEGWIKQSVCSSFVTWEPDSSSNVAWHLSGNDCALSDRCICGIDLVVKTNAKIAAGNKWKYWGQNQLICSSSCQLKDILFSSSRLGTVLVDLWEQTCKAAPVKENGSPIASKLCSKTFGNHRERSCSQWKQGHRQTLLDWGHNCDGASWNSLLRSIDFCSNNFEMPGDLNVFLFWPKHILLVVGLDGLVETSLRSGELWVCAAWMNWEWKEIIYDKSLHLIAWRERMVSRNAHVTVQKANILKQRAVCWQGKFNPQMISL